MACVRRTCRGSRRRAAKSAGSPTGGKFAAPSADDGPRSATRTGASSRCSTSTARASRATRRCCSCRYLMEHDMLEHSGVILRILSVGGCLQAAPAAERELGARPGVHGVSRARSARARWTRFLADVLRRDASRSAVPQPRPTQPMARPCGGRRHGVVVISATFEPIILRAMEHHPLRRSRYPRACASAADGTLHARGGGPARGGRGEDRGRAGASATSRFGPGNWVLGQRLRRPSFRPRGAAAPPDTPSPCRP